MTNRLADAASPYLLQHQHNPVHWQPWDPQSLAQARSEEKPIFLSIGYSACHWCHVMERESFENDDIAEKLNASFVCIKVDREERPDLDQIYMEAVQILTRQGGGWPLNVFLTPDGAPFYGGTYWPPEPRWGRPGFGQVVEAVANLWRDRRDQAVSQGTQVAQYLEQEAASGDSWTSEQLKGLFQMAEAALAQTFDETNGGFGGRPKFPHAMDLQFLLRRWKRTGSAAALEMVKTTLTKMAYGGIYDQLGGGFARYSVDEHWLVPHFEKMLYDNGLLTRAYVDAFRVTSEPLYERIARETLDYTLELMTDESGAFYSTEDADSEGEEGRFYVWSPDEIVDVLGPETAAQFNEIYGVTKGGNFEETGKSILHLKQPIAATAKAKGWDVAATEVAMAEARSKLLEVRNRRVRPGKDDKVLVSWNCFMIDAMAAAASAFGEATYLAAAEKAADFIWQSMRRPDGRLMHAWRNGEPRLDAYLDDYASYINALVTLYEASFDERWISRAIETANKMLTHFSDPAGGGFYFTADDHEELLVRRKDLQDGSVPSGNSMAATALVRLAKLTGNAAYEEAARGTIDFARSLLERAPQATGQMLIAADMLLGPVQEIVIAGDRGNDDTQQAIAAAGRSYLPNCVFAFADGRAVDDHPLAELLAGKTIGDSQPTIYVCENFACREPIAGAEVANQLWETLSSPTAINQ